VTTTTGPEGGGPSPRAALLAMIEGYWLSQIARAAADIGGGDGTLLRALLTARPGLRGILFDLPAAAAAAGAGIAAAGLSGRLAAVGGDFLAGVPAADLYLVKAVLHDWDDDVAARILANCHAAARPGARLVIIENLLGPPGEWGAPALLDLSMLVVAGGRERDLD
jgi:SAM-dependent methyltransferase